MVACIATTKLLNCLACIILHEATMLSPGLEVEAARKSILNFAGVLWLQCSGSSGRAHTYIHRHKHTDPFAVINLKCIM